LLTGDEAIIASGLAVDDKVVVEGQNQLRPGGRVEPIAPRQPVGSGSAARASVSPP
jgi:hypothetical protein